MRKQVKLNGITTIPNHEDGDAIVCVNLRKHNGTLKPVPPRKKVKELSILYDFVYIHDTPNSVRNWIGVKGGQLWHIKSANDSQLSDEPILTLSSTPSITQIGNILNIIDNTGLKYLFWYENEYKVINTDFDGEQTDTVLGPVKVDLRVTAHDDVRNYLGGSSTGATETQAIAVFEGLISKAESIEKRDGRLSGFMLACTAIELYDGSYILHSNPVLLGQANDIITRFSNFTINTHLNLDYLNRNVGFQSLYADNVLNAIDQYNTCTNVNQLTAYYSSTADWVAITTQPNISLNFDPGSEGVYKCFKSANKLQFKINATILEKYAVLIKSVSIFITKQVSMYTGKVLNTISLDSGFAEKKTNADILKEMSENQIFYKVHEITFDELQSIEPETWITIDLKGKLGDNLANQERLPVDNFSHHKLVPVSQYVYNSRLHAMDYTTILSRGWPVNYFYQTNGIGQFQSTEHEGELDVQGWLESIEVKIKTENGISNVVRITPELQGEFLKLFNLSPMLSYPDARGTEIILYRSYYDASEGRYLEQRKIFKLTQSESHNFAYYIDPNLKPINLTELLYSDEHGIPAEANRTQIYRNGLKVSALANPFYFANENTYKVGNKTILGASSNAMRMSEGQYGQFPLYIFCTDGIFALNVGSDIVYTNLTPVSNELPVSNKLLPTPYGVVFFGQRGLYIVSGQRVERLTPQLELIQPHYNLNLTSNFTIDIERDFTKFIQEATALTYDFSNSELHICNNKYDYTLVINIEQKHIYISTQTWDGTTGQYLIAGTKIIDIAQYESEYADVALITRPINFDTNDMKNVERAVIRGMFKEALNLNLSNLSSLDSVNFIPRQSKGLKEGSYIDLNLGLISNKTRYSIFAISGTLHSESEITNLEYEVNAEYKGIR